MLETRRMNVEVKYLINIVSLMRFEPHLVGIPECFFRKPFLLIEDALNIGFGGVQAVPTRGMTGYEANILLYEDAWNPVDSLLQAIRHIPGAAGKPSSIIDWVVSPNPDTCRRIQDRLSYRGIPIISHQLRNELYTLWKPGLLEIHPGLDLTAEEILAFCKSSLNTRLVLDTYHLRRGFRSDEVFEKPERNGRTSPLGKFEIHWARTIRTLAPYTSIIHLNPGDDPTEMEAFLLAPLSTITGRLFHDMLMDTQKHEYITVVVECRPKLFGKGGLEQARKALEVAKKMVAKHN